MTVKHTIPQTAGIPNTVSAISPPAITCACTYTVAAIRITTAASARARRL